MLGCRICFFICWIEGVKEDILLFFRVFFVWVGVEKDSLDLGEVWDRGKRVGCLEVLLF